MIRWHWSTTVTALVFVLAGFLAFGGPASAEECADTVGEAVAAVEASGGYLVDLIEVESDHFDQLLVIIARGTTKDALIIGGVRNGCMVTGPFTLDSVEPVTPA